MERGRAASALGHLDRELKELDAGIQAVGAKDPNAYEFYNRRAPLDLDRGDHISARATRELALEVAGSAGRQFFQLNYLSSISAVLRDRDSAETYLSRADSLLFSVRRGNPEWGRFGNFWQAATHGLVPGELPDLAPTGIGAERPGYYWRKRRWLADFGGDPRTELKADWVVLSACNTASADGQASEAVSGLGRAFFFAGAKALLVSHWPVETVSARLLTTELFKRQSGNAKISRAQALREASLAVMQQSAGKSYSYAHPHVLGTLVVFGDGG